MISASGTESKPKTRAYIKRQWCFGPGGMQNNVYDFGGHPKLLAPQLCVHGQVLFETRYERALRVTKESNATLSFCHRYTEGVPVQK